MEIDASLSNGREIFAHMDKPQLKAVVDAWIGEVTDGLGNLVNIFDPECLILGGGIMHTLVCWTPEGKKAPFVCIEPMYSFGDSARSQELKEMKETMQLDAGQSKAFTNTIRIF